MSQNPAEADYIRQRRRLHWVVVELSSMDLHCAMLGLYEDDDFLGD